jgi:hypothetical protein
MNENQPSWFQRNQALAIIGGIAVALMCCCITGVIVTSLGLFGLTAAGLQDAANQGPTEQAADEAPTEKSPPRSNGKTKINVLGMWSSTEEKPNVVDAFARAEKGEEPENQIGFEFLPNNRFSHHIFIYDAPKQYFRMKVDGTYSLQGNILKLKAEDNDEGGAISNTKDQALIAKFQETMDAIGVHGTCEFQVEPGTLDDGREVIELDCKSIDGKACDRTETFYKVK